MKTLNDQQVNMLREILRALYMDCHLALTGKWDKSDDGFKDSLQSVKDAAGVLEIELWDEETDNRLNEELDAIDK